VNDHIHTEARMAGCPLPPQAADQIETEQTLAIDARATVNLLVELIVNTAHEPREDKWAAHMKSAQPMTLVELSRLERIMELANLLSGKTL